MKAHRYLVKLRFFMTWSIFKLRFFRSRGVILISKTDNTIKAVTKPLYPGDISGRIMQIVKTFMLLTGMDLMLE